jgi:hypothetical protein
LYVGCIIFHDRSGQDLRYDLDDTGRLLHPPTRPTRVLSAALPLPPIPLPPVLRQKRASVLSAISRPCHFQTIHLPVVELELPPIPVTHLMTDELDYSALDDVAQCE